jgi:hydroxyacylglutathione hydrolase
MTIPMVLPNYVPNILKYLFMGINSIAHITHTLTGGEILNIKDFGRFLVLDTKGHTQYHLAYYHLQQKLLYCGDSLFSGGCGRIFPDGSAENAYHSLQKISLLPQETQVCGSHEYTLDNLAFAQHIEPNNLALTVYQQHCQQLRQQNLATLPSTLRNRKTH